MTTQHLQVVVMVVFWLTGLVATHYTVRTLALALRAMRSGR